MMAALVGSVNTRRPALNINIDEHYHTDCQQETQQGEDDGHEDEEVVHLGQELPGHDHGILVRASDVTDVLDYHPVCDASCSAL